MQYFTPILALVVSYVSLVNGNMKMPPQQPPSKQGSNGGGQEMMMVPRPIRIIRMKSVSDIDGNYNYAYESENGIRMQEQGFIKQGEKKEDHINVAQGSYSYTSPEGMPIRVNYIADENGFQVLDSDDDESSEMKQTPMTTTMRPTTTESASNSGKNSYINEHILRQGSAQQFYRFFKPQIMHPEEEENEEQYENY